MLTDRRAFLQVSAGVMLGTGSLAAAMQPKATVGVDLLRRMKWLNPPASVHQSGGQLTVRSAPKTDFWRKTFFGYITDNGHLLSLPVEGDFTFQARVGGRYAAQYDQAGLMVRLDEVHWMKCGTELVDGNRNASVVFTHDFSDWSTLPDLSQTAPIWWRAVRKKDSIEAHCSLDGVKFMVVRQGYFPAQIAVGVGVMCAAPEGQGFDAVFDELRLDLI